MGSNDLCFVRSEEGNVIKQEDERPEEGWKDKSTNLEAENGSLTTKSISLEDATGSLETKSTSLEDATGSLETKSTSSEDAIGSLKTKSTSLNERNTLEMNIDLENELKSFKNRVEMLEDENHILETNCNMLQEENYILTSEKYKGGRQKNNRLHRGHDP